MRRRVRKAIGFPASTFCPLRSTIHLRGRPVLWGLYVSTSRRFRSTLPPISNVRKRPFWISRPIACGETPRIRAASDCETQSFASNFFLEKVLELFKYFRLRFGMGVFALSSPGKCEAVPIENNSARVPRGRVGAINTDASLTTITSLGGNDGCN